MVAVSRAALFACRRDGVICSASASMFWPPQSAAQPRSLKAVRALRLRGMAFLYSRAPRYSCISFHVSRRALRRTRGRNAERGSGGGLFRTFFILGTVSSRGRTGRGTGRKIDTIKKNEDRRNVLKRRVECVGSFLRWFREGDTAMHNPHVNRISIACHARQGRELARDARLCRVP